MGYLRNYKGKKFNVFAGGDRNKAWKYLIYVFLFRPSWHIARFILFEDRDGRDGEQLRGLVAWKFRKDFGRWIYKLSKRSKNLHWQIFKVKNWQKHLSCEISIPWNKKDGNLCFPGHYSSVLKRSWIYLFPFWRAEKSRNKKCARNINTKCHP